MKKHGIRCKVCGDRLFSETVHDFVTCSCYGKYDPPRYCYIDGGNDYTRIGGDPNDYEDISKEV